MREDKAEASAQHAESKRGAPRGASFTPLWCGKNAGEARPWPQSGALGTKGETCKIMYIMHANSVPSRYPVVSMAFFQPTNASLPCFLLQIFLLGAYGLLPPYQPSTSYATPVILRKANAERSKKEGLQTIDMGRESPPWPSGAASREPSHRVAS